MTGPLLPGLLPGAASQRGLGHRRGFERGDPRFSCSIGVVGLRGRHTIGWRKELVLHRIDAGAEECVVQLDPVRCCHDVTRRRWQKSAKVAKVEPRRHDGNDYAPGGDRVLDLSTQPVIGVATASQCSRREHENEVRTGRYLLEQFEIEWSGFQLLDVVEHVHRIGLHRQALIQRQRPHRALRATVGDERAVCRRHLRTPVRFRARGRVRTPDWTDAGHVPGDTSWRRAETSRSVQRAGREGGVEAEAAPSLALADGLAPADPQRRTTAGRAGQLVATGHDRAISRHLFLGHPQAICR